MKTNVKKPQVKLYVPVIAESIGPYAAIEPKPDGWICKYEDHRAAMHWYGEERAKEAASTFASAIIAAEWSDEGCCPFCHAFGAATNHAHSEDCIVHAAKQAATGDRK